MYSNGRPVVPEFNPEESVYLRFGVEDFLDGQLLPSSVRASGQSVNRGSFSEPEDALFHPEGKYNGLGAVEFKVKVIPATVTGEQGSVFIFFMKHKPLEENYAHSEIWADKPPATGACRTPSRSVALKFRVQLCQRVRAENIRIHPVRSRQQ
jgi:hypothetical protein